MVLDFGRENEPAECVFTGRITLRLNGHIDWTIMGDTWPFFELPMTNWLSKSNDSFNVTHFFHDFHTEVRNHRHKWIIGCQHIRPESVVIWCCSPQRNHTTRPYAKCQTKTTVSHTIPNKSEYYCIVEKYISDVVMHANKDRDCPKTTETFGRRWSAKMRKRFRLTAAMNRIELR